MSTTPLTLFRNRSKIYDVVPRDRDNNLIDSGSIAQIWFIAKRSMAQVDDEAIFEKTLGDGIESVSDALDTDGNTYAGYRITLSDSDTESLENEEIILEYELSLQDTTDLTYALQNGPLIVLPNILLTTT